MLRVLFPFILGHLLLASPPSAAAAAAVAVSAAALTTPFRAHLQRIEELDGEKRVDGAVLLRLEESDLRDFLALPGGTAENEALRRKLYERIAKVSLTEPKGGVP